MFKRRRLQRNPLTNSEAEESVKKRRALAVDRVFLVDVESRGEGTGKAVGGGRVRMATFGGGNYGSDPAVGIGKAISDALDPNKVPKKVETFAEMSEEKKAEMVRLYGKK